MKHPDPKAPFPWMTLLLTLFVSSVLLISLCLGLLELSRGQKTIAPDSRLSSLPSPVSLWKQNQKG